MKYPKDVIIQALHEKDDCAFCETIAEYANWAHEQLRPSKVSEEKSPIGRRIEVYSNLSNAWIHAHFMCEEELSEELSSSVFTYWRHIGPPPEDDGFEAWVENHPEMDPPKLWKTRLQECWQAAQSAMRKEDKE